MWALPPSFVPAAETITTMIPINTASPTTPATP
jgi:hypothetical protein